MDAPTMPVLLWTDVQGRVVAQSTQATTSVGLVFVTVVMLSNPGVDVPLSHMPTLVLVVGRLPSGLFVPRSDPIRVSALA
jgi:hypothetical protein